MKKWAVQVNGLFLKAVVWKEPIGDKPIYTEDVNEAKTFQAYGNAEKMGEKLKREKHTQKYNIITLENI